jgi:hypothetical protein
MASTSDQDIVLYNKFNVTKDSYVIPVSTDIVQKVRLGGGLNLDDPFNPQTSSTLSFF